MLLLLFWCERVSEKSGVIFCRKSKLQTDASGTGYSFSLLMAMRLSVLAGGHAGELLKLAHKMQFVIITAEYCQGGDGHFGNAQIKPGVLNPGMNHILNTGGAEKMFI